MLTDHVHALKKGTQLNQYTIEGVLGSGGFGITYLAHDTTLDLRVAIKEFLPSDLATREDGSQVTAKSTTARTDFRWGLDRFLEEAKTLAKFRHPNIVHVFQVFEANNTAYIVMEYAEGEPLSELVQRSGYLTEQQTKDILLPIMDGLKRVHDMGFLHRDIKPGNILLRAEGGPVLIDFGAARQAIETKSRSITSIVTEGYAPLEQYDPNGNQGPWTDIHGLAAVAYKCLTGNTPPAATSRVRNDPLAPLRIAAKDRVSKEFAAAVEWGLAVYEDMRPQSVDEFARAMAGDMSARRTVALPSEATRLVPAESTHVLDMAATRIHQQPANAPGSALAIPSPAIRMPSSRSLVYAGAVVVALVLASGAYFLFNRHAEPVDQAAWDVAAQEDKIPSYELYQRKEVNGFYADRAQTRINERTSQIETAWSQARAQKTSVALSEFLAKYEGDGLHVSEANNLISQLREQERKQRMENMAMQQRLRDAGAYNGPITGDSAQTAATLKTFQMSSGLQATGAADTSTVKALDDAIVRNRETREAYSRATQERSRQAYNTFLARYGKSTYASDIKDRMARCRVETTPRTTPQIQTVQKSGTGSGGDENSSCSQARQAALNDLRQTCSAEEASMQNTQVVSDTPKENLGGELLGGLLGKAIFGKRGGNVGRMLECTSVVQTQCIKMVTTSTSAEICP